MFELGSWSEFLIILVAVLVLIKPAEFPILLRTLGRWIRKLRLLSYSLQHHMETYIEESELDDLQKKTNDLVLKKGGLEPPQKPSRSRPKSAKKKKATSS